MFSGLMLSLLLVVFCVSSFAIGSKIGPIQETWSQARGSSSLNYFAPISTASAPSGWTGPTCQYSMGAAAEGHDGIMYLGCDSDLLEIFVSNGSVKATHEGVKSSCVVALTDGSLIVSSGKTGMGRYFPTNQSWAWNCSTCRGECASSSDHGVTCSVKGEDFTCVDTETGKSLSSGSTPWVGGLVSSSSSSVLTGFRSSVSDGIIAKNAVNGDTLWTNTVPNIGAVAADSSVFVGAGNGENFDNVVAIARDVETGKLLWKTDNLGNSTVNLYLSKSDSFIFLVVCPIQLQTCTLLALDNTGTQKWEQQTPTPQSSLSPIFATILSTKDIVCLLPGGCFNASTGKPMASNLPGRVGIALSNGLVTAAKDTPGPQQLVAVPT